jgi:hypothetical protein
MFFYSHVYRSLDKGLTCIKERSKTLHRLTENYHCRIDTGSH